jgi:hypothetical protein
MPVDIYDWIGSSGGSWQSASNWQDVTSGQDPATTVPGANNPVTISGPTGSIYEVISGGGAAASVALTGLVDLVGAYNAGALNVGTVQAGTSLASATLGDLVLGAGSSLQASGTLAVADGTLAVSGTGVGLSAGGAVTIGMLQGEYLSGGTGYFYFSGVAGALTAAGAARVAAAGNVTVGDGTLSATGAGTTVTIGGSLVLGSPGTSTYVEPYTDASPGSLSILNGASVAVAGAITAYDDDNFSAMGNSGIDVSGAGSRLTAGGTLTLDNSYAYEYLFASSGAVVQLGGLSLVSSTTSGDYSYLDVDSASSIEIGTAGSAAIGAITIDPGVTIAAATTAYLSGNVVDNGVISETGSALTVSGTLSGTGVAQITAGEAFSVGGLSGTAQMRFGPITS